MIEQTKMNNSTQIFVRFIGKEDDPEFKVNGCYLLKVHGMTISCLSLMRSYDSIESFLKEWSFVVIDFMSDLNE